MAENDIYLVRQKNDGTFEELGDSPFAYSGLTGDVSDAGNEFLIKTKLRVPELKVEGTTTIVDQDVTTSEQLLITNDGTGPAVVINQLGTEAALDVQDDGASALYVRGDSPYAGYVGLGTTTPTKQLELTGDILLANDNAIYFNDVTAGTPVAKKSLYQDSAEILTLANTGGDGVNIKTGDSSSFLALRIDQSGFVGIGSEVTAPAAHLDIVRDGQPNIKFRHKSNSAVGEIDIDMTQTVGSVQGVMTIGTKTNHALTLGTNNVGFLKISQDGNISLERKEVNGVMTTANLTIEGELSVPNATTFKVAGEELLWTDEFSVTGANHAESFKFLEFSYRTHGWDDGSPFIIEIWSEYYSATGYQKYLVCHTHLDTDEDGTQGEVGAPDLDGGRDYQLKILESASNPPSAKFRLRMGTPEDTGLNDGDGYDIATVAVHAELKHYAKTRIKVTSLASNPTAQIGTNDDWTTASDEYKFYTSPIGVDITNDWDSYPFDPTGEDALYADAFYGSRMVNDIGTDTDPTTYFLKPADTGTSMIVAGNVGIGTDSPTENLTIAGPTARNFGVRSTGDLGTEIKLSANRNGAGETIGNLTGYWIDTADATERAVAQIRFLTGDDTTNEDDGELAFYTASPFAERMRIDQLGNVGIGTSAPGQKLEVAGNVKMGNDGSSSNLYIHTNATGNSAAGVQLHAPDSDNRTLLSRQVGTHSGHANEFHIGHHIGGTLVQRSKWMPNGDVVLTSVAGGNVGIGTDSPSTTLEIRASASPTLLLSQDVSTDGLKFVADTTSSYVHTITHNDSGLIFNSSHLPSTSRPYAFMDGDVGIGTDSPSGKLHVVVTGDGDDVKFETATDHDLSLTLEAGTSDNQFRLIVRDEVDRLDIASDTTNPLMSFLDSGNVGIGTTTPDYAKLDIVGNETNFLGADLGQFIRIYHDDQDPNPDSAWYLGQRKDGAFKISEAADDRLVIDGAGNVGIGTNSPGDKLTVESSKIGGSVTLSVRNSYYAEDSTAEKSSLQGEFLRKDTEEFRAGGMIQFEKADDWTDITNCSANMNFYTRKNDDLTKHMTIDPDGNVGIGEVAPARRLEVKGHNNLTSAIKITNTNTSTYAPGHASALEVYELIADVSVFISSQEWDLLPASDPGGGASWQGLYAVRAPENNTWAIQSDYDNQTLSFKAHVSGEDAVGNTGTWGGSGNSILRLHERGNSGYTSTPAIITHGYQPPAADSNAFELQAHHGGRNEYSKTITFDQAAAGVYYFHLAFVNDSYGMHYKLTLTSGRYNTPPNTAPYSRTINRGSVIDESYFYFESDGEQGNNPPDTYRSTLMEASTGTLNLGEVTSYVADSIIDEGPDAGGSSAYDYAIVRYPITLPAPTHTGNVTPQGRFTAHLEVFGFNGFEPPVALPPQFLHVP